MQNVVYTSMREQIVLRVGDNRPLCDVADFFDMRAWKCVFK